MRLIFVSIFFFVSVVVFSQIDIYDFEEQVRLKLSAVRESKEDEEKIKNSELLETYLLENLPKVSEAFLHDFKSLKSMSTIISPDEEFRFFNWNVELSDLTHRYYGMIMVKEKRQGDYRVISLNDNRFFQAPRTDDKLDQDTWRGSLYYDIIPIDKGNKRYYTLLAYDGNTRSSNIKIIDVLYFQGKSAKFGYPLFDTPEGVKKRVYMEYKENVIVSVKFHPDKNMVIFDHLSPETEALEGFREFYVPDLSYDAFEWQKNRWVYKADVTPMNKASKEDKLWKDPTDKNTPVDNGEHVKVPVDETAKDKNGRDKVNENKITNKTPRFGKLFKTKKNKKPRSAIGK